MRTYDYLCADFETTVYKGQDRTDVWASAVVDLWCEDVHIHHSINEFMDYIFKYKSNKNRVIFFHNLKFDGTFILDYLLHSKFKLAGIDYNESGVPSAFQTDSDMYNNTYKYSISDRGAWYNIIIKKNNKLIEFRDSYKLIPFSIKEIGEAFQTTHRKLDMVYEGFRYPGCEITQQEKEYIKNDVLVMKEAIEFMFNKGHTSITIGSCCLKEYKNICRKSLKLPADYNEMFPNLYERYLNDDMSIGDYIRKSYYGGWCYLNDKIKGKVVNHGLTLDVTSLYPSVMHSISRNRYPIGLPTKFECNIPEIAKEDDKYFLLDYHADLK